jgi:hypothetical protein
MSPNGRADIWQERYIAAILEIDSEKIPLRVRAAKMAICDRDEELNGGGECLGAGSTQPSYEGAR